MNPDWAAGAACRGKPYELFYGAEGKPLDPGPALALCASCPSIEQCRAYAIHNGDIDARGRATHGVIAGATPPKKRDVPAPARKACALPDCTVRFTPSHKGSRFYCCADHAAQGHRLSKRASYERSRAG